MKFRRAGAGLVAGVAAISIIISGCTGSSSAGGGASEFSNISGTVAQSVSGSGLMGKLSRKAGVNSKVSSMTVESGCSVEALSLVDGSSVATAQTDADGHYTLSGVDAGTTYKIIATCGSNKYSSVASAAVTNPASLDETERVATNPRSTLIAAYIVKSILDAVDQSTSGIANQTIVDSIKSAIFGSLDSVIQTVQSTIEEAIESGAMQEPDLTASTAVTDGLAALTDISDVTQAISDVDSAISDSNIEAPVSVTQSITGATQKSAAKQACSLALNGSESACVQSVARLMYNVLGFPVAIKTSGGVFNLSGCSSGDTINGTGESVADAFPNSTVIDGASDPDYPDELCIIKPVLGSPDRNRGYEPGGEHSGPLFSETADMDGDTNDDVGVLSAMGAALFNNYTYLLSDINRLVFDYQNGAGMNSRVVNQRFIVNSSGGAGEMGMYYYNGTSWVNTLWPADCGFGSDEICRWWDLNFNFTDATWASAQNNGPLAAAIGTSQVGLKIMAKKFGGAVPTQSEVDTYIDLGRIHVDHNITGEKEFSVVTTKPAGFGSNGENPCWDKDPATVCLDPDGTAVVPVRVDLALNATPDATGFKRITTITAGVGGAYYLWPMYGPNGFSGVLGFIKVSDGKIVQDELLRQRAVKVILHAGECNLYGVPAAGCAAGKIYNVELDWSACSGGTMCPGYTENGADASVTGYAVNVQSDYRASWEQFCGVSGCMGHQLVGTGDWGSMTPFKFSITPQTGSSDTLTLTGTGKATASGEYNLAIYSNCTSAGCTFSGFYLVDQSGAMHDDSDVNCASCSAASFWGGTNIGLYTQTYINSGNDFDFDGGNGNTGVQTVAANYWIFNAPIPNPNFSCEGEPLFIDGNGNGVLDCGLVSGVSRAINGDVSFSGEWEYSWYLQDPSLTGSQVSARQAQPLLQRENAFAFKNPLGTKKLLSAAFDGWFDGAHSITSTTTFNALQVFSLVYLFFEEGEEYKHISGLISGQDRFSLESPLFSDSGNDTLLMNKAIGQAFLDFRQQ